MNSNSPNFINVHRRGGRVLRVYEYTLPNLLSPFPPSLNKPLRKTTRNSCFTKIRETASLRRNNYYPGSIRRIERAGIPRGHVFLWGGRRSTLLSSSCSPPSCPSYFPPRLSYAFPLLSGRRSADSRGGWPWEGWEERVVAAASV